MWEKKARVFPTKTSMSPTDRHAYFGAPDLFTPMYDVVFISVTFTWDIEKARYLKRCWEGRAKDVLIGGPAIDGESKEFMVGGRFLKKGITITSRGCPNNCSFCMIKNNLIELRDFPTGHIVQDNNILVCSDSHRRRVWDMLKTQKRIEFKGGLEASRITPKIAEELRSLSVRSLWLACDHPNAIKPVKKAIKILQKVGFTRSHIYCYTLIGKDRQEEENRLYEVLRAGAMPFAQLYRDREDSIKYSYEWKKFQREWARPAITRSKLKEDRYGH